MDELIAIALDQLDDDDEEVFAAPRRRPRFIRDRVQHFEELDDADFVMRFRFSKEMTLMLLEKIDIHLEFPTDK